MKLAKILLFFILITNQAHGKMTKGLKVTLELSPIGSFVIETSKIKGKLVKFKEGYKSKKIYLKVKDLTTGIDLRDQHLKEKLMISKFPKIYVSEVNTVKNKGSAKIKIKNIIKKISFKFKELENNFIEANFQLSLVDFNIKGIRYMGVGVKDKIKVSIVLPSKN